MSAALQGLWLTEKKNDIHNNKNIVNEHSSHRSQDSKDVIVECQIFYRRRTLLYECNLKVMTTWVGIKHELCEMLTQSQ